MGTGLKSARDQQEDANIRLDSTTDSNQPRRDELVPSRYALRVGEIDVMVVSDGVLSLPGEMLGHNADPTVRGAWLEEKFLPPVWPEPCAHSSSVDNKAGVFSDHFFDFLLFPS